MLGQVILDGYFKRWVRPVMNCVLLFSNYSGRVVPTPCGPWPARGSSITQSSVGTRLTSTALYRLWLVLCIQIDNTTYCLHDELGNNEFWTLILCNNCAKRCPRHAKYDVRTIWKQFLNYMRIGRGNITTVSKVVMRRTDEHTRPE